MKKLNFLLYPISLIYELYTSFRNFLFDLGIIDSIEYKIPTIGIGNLSTGGTGKSIVVDYIIGKFKNKNKITTLSRGYNRNTKGFVQASNISTAYEIGDEPFQFYSKHPEINVVVCEDRRKGMNIILKNLPYTDLCIWDDVFQHRFVKPGLMILTTTFQYPFYKDEILPIGNLRENISSAKRADLIVVTKCPDNLSQKDKLSFLESLNPNDNQKVFFSSLTYMQKIKSDSEEVDIDVLEDDDFILVTGIADSSYLVNFLKNKALKFKHLKYSDHYNFNKSSIDKISGLSLNKIILTTEKDFGRLKPRINNRDIYYIEVGLKFPEEINEYNFDKNIEDYIFND
ncbi:tetraacyldisaccharide 4'-kinase [Flavobacteriaceae bacterium]|nr:tetraacyldisaccharide 4'-kinase [Flavobacteriaceae bacterium]MDB3874313.1 tetraacyldisaccharide 4'-kinase [Flavobacteriaceae bacterium]MDC6462083.1 tetraacyldisaccharide 4'-kinase [Flavobacteriaceae bacterium]